MSRGNFNSENFNSEKLAKLKKSTFDYLRHDFFMEVLAGISFAVGVAVFSSPNKIVGGGVTGIAIILNNLFNLPIGSLTFFLNLPLIVIGFLYVGRGFMLRTFRVVILFSVIVDGLTPFLPTYTGNTILASVFSGILIGLTLGIILMRGGSTGGTDILVKLIKKHNPHLPMGNVVMLTDVVVILGGAVVFRDIEVILLGIICTYVQSAVINRMIEGEDERWMMLAITKRYKEISLRVMEEVDRGATVIKCFGAFSGDEMGIVLCVMASREVFIAKRVIKEMDPKAFTIVTSATETLGEGFKDILKEEN
ncbi:MAG: YitT family protein [Oscillospiraceae bacterium]